MRQAGRSEQLRLRLVGPPWGGESTSLLSTLRGWRAGPPHPRVAALLRHTLRVLEALVFGSCRLGLYEGLQGHQPLGWGAGRGACVYHKRVGHGCLSLFPNIYINCRGKNNFSGCI